MNHVDFAVLVQLLAGNLQFHLDGILGLPIGTLIVLNGDIVSKQLCSTALLLCQNLIDELLNTGSSLLNGHTSILGDALNADRGAVHVGLGSRAGGGIQQLHEGSIPVGQVLLHIPQHVSLLLGRVICPHSHQVLRALSADHVIACSDNAVSSVIINADTAVTVAARRCRRLGRGLHRSCHSGVGHQFCGARGCAHILSIHYHVFHHNIITDNKVADIILCDVDIVCSACLNSRDCETQHHGQTKKQGKDFLHHFSNTSHFIIMDL